MVNIGRLFEKKGKGKQMDRDIKEKNVQYQLGTDSKKKNVIFSDIVTKGGRGSG